MKLLLPDSISCWLHCPGCWKGWFSSHLPFHWCSRKWNWFVAATNYSERENRITCQMSFSYFSGKVGCFIIQTWHWGWFSCELCLLCILLFLSSSSWVIFPSLFIPFHFFSWIFVHYQFEIASNIFYYCKGRIYSLVSGWMSQKIYKRLGLHLFI